ncbi:MAG: class II aldolase/adducin family protein [Firmicutes bacterium]|nr:class II aldolase/adducin family protein [Bacillota bacterium]
MDAVLLYAWRVPRDGLGHGTSGNLSRRVGANTVRITPSGIPFPRLSDADLIDLRVEDGGVLAGHWQPSSEWRLHCALYRQHPSVHGIVHVHSPFATVFACLGRPIEAVHYLIAKVGPRIPVVPYATYGTQLLAERVSEGLMTSRAVLLENHGLVTVGATLAEAYQLALDVEWLAGLYYRTLSIGQPRILDEAEIARVQSAFRHYGPDRD